MRKNTHQKEMRESLSEYADEREQVGGIGTVLLNSDRQNTKIADLQSVINKGSEQFN